MGPTSDFLAKLAANPGLGELGQLTAKLDWSKTSVGDSGGWPHSLKTLISTLLVSRYPMVLTWGPQYAQFYNDAYSKLIGEKHPSALGEDIRVTLAESWHILGPMIETVMQTGVANWTPALPLLLERSGYREESYFSVSHAPARDDVGNIVGMLAVCSEVTQQVVGERRLQLLRDLSARSAEIKDVQGTCSQMVEEIAKNLLDIPFAAIYVRENRKLVLASSVGLSEETRIFPKELSLEQSHPLWSANHEEAVVNHDVSQYVKLRGGFFQDPITSAIVLPLGSSEDRETIGLIIAAISPNRELDDTYRSFYELLAAQVAINIRNAQAYIEERQRADALAALDRAKTEFFSNVSHEFRTPLTLMLGPLEDTLGDRELLLSERNKSNLEAVQRNSVRLLKLVNSLLDFSRLESNRLHLKFQKTDLAQLTCDLASSFRSACEKAGLALRLDCSAEDAVAYVDREMWEKIILNLVSNAFKYTLKGSIAIRTESNLDQVRITVEDTGVGIPETDRENVFKRFHRVHRSEGRSHEGSGIGLALVDEAVRLHGGSIRLESQIGKGSRFTISIPKGQAHLPQQLVEEKTVEARTLAAPMLFAQEATSLVERDSNQRSVAKTKKSARILLAEDNHDMRDYITRLLEDRFDVIAVKDGQEALNLIGEEMPDIVLSDIMMPKLDGIELLNRIRSDQHLRSLPVILLSARAGEEARIEGLEMTADDYLVKPFTARELIARISTHLDLARVRKESLEREQTLRSEAVAAKRSSELKDQFLATVSHELRTPLNIIRGHSDLLRDTDLTENEKLESLDAIQRNVDAQTKIIEDLLDLSRLMSGKLHLDAKDLNLTEVIQSAVENITTAIKAKQLALQTDFGSCAAFVKGDAVRLSQIVWNLLSNSVKFTPSGGRVSVRCELKEKLVEIKVADSGIGIAPEFLPYAFDVFRQEDSAYTRKHGGLGLGLAIVRELAEAHGGSIRAESEGRGKGTTFTLALPTINFNQVAESTPATERPTTGEKLKGLRLLAVDDHPETLDLISTLLQKAGAKVFKANSAAEAYDKLFEVRPDVLISDISMPVEDGYSLIKRIRSLPVEKGGSIPAVAVTAFTRDIDRKKAIQAGFHAHLGKPVDRLQLVDTIQKLTSIVPSIVSAESAKSTMN